MILFFLPYSMVIVMVYYFLNGIRSFNMQHDAIATRVDAPSAVPMFPILQRG